MAYIFRGSDPTTLLLRSDRIRRARGRMDARQEPTERIRPTPRQRGFVLRGRHLVHRSRLQASAFRFTFVAFVEGAFLWDQGEGDVAGEEGGEGEGW